MFKKFYDLFSIVRYLELLFKLVKKVAAPLESLIIPFFDWRLKPDRPYEPGRGSSLQLVIRPDDRAYVGWPVLKYVFPFLSGQGQKKAQQKTGEDEFIEEPQVSFFQMLFRALFLLFFLIVVVIFISLNPRIADYILPKGFLRFDLGNLSFPTLPSIGISGMLTLGLFLVVVLVIFLLLLWLVGLVFTYWRHEWQRRNTVYAFFIEGLLHLEAEFIGRAVSPFYIGENTVVDTFTPAVEMMEIELVTDVENLKGGEKTLTWQDKWSQYLSKKYQMKSIRIASRSGADDILRSVAFAPTTMSCINKIIDQGVLYKKTHQSFQEKEQEAKSANADSLNFDASAGARKVERVWDNFERLYPQGANKFDDAFDLQDPGVWDRHTGEERKVRNGKTTVISQPVAPQQQGSSLESPPAQPSSTQEEKVSPHEEVDESSSYFPPLNRERKFAEEPQSQPPTTPEPPKDRPQDTEQESSPNDEDTDSFWGALSS